MYQVVHFIFNNWLITLFAQVNKESDLLRRGSGLAVFCAELKSAWLSSHGRISLTHFVEDATFEMVNIRNWNKKNATLQTLNKHNFTDDYICGCVFWSHIIPIVREPETSFN